MAKSNKKQSLPGQFPVPRNSNKNQSSKSRFGSSSSSRFGGSSSGSSSSSRFGGSSSSRFGSSRFGSKENIHWTITPSQKIAVRISLQGLGDPLHRLIGTALNPELSNPAKVIEMLSKDQELLDKLAIVLDEAWQSYELRGAAMLYPWEDNIRSAFTSEVQPTTPPPPKKDDASGDDEYIDEEAYDDDDEDDNTADWLAGKTAKRVQSLRAIDVAFVMNILARSRANVVVGNTPLALEPGFLEKTVICDDPRIVKIAQATGCIDEDW